MNRNSAPCTVPNMSSCGVRKNWRIVRLALWSDAVSQFAPVARGVDTSAVTSVVCVLVVVIREPLRSGGVGRGRLRVGVGITRVEALAGDGEEHLVEAGSAQTDVVDLDVA